MAALDFPDENIAEVTLVGTGGGYGESSVLHMGNNEWIIVDSCLNPNTKKSLSLEYLLDIGVDVGRAVKMIICTHWHDDHILGISQLLEVCKSAMFCMANINDRKKFLQLVTLDHHPLKKEASNSSTLEFEACLKIIRERNTDIIRAIKDRCLISFGNNQLFSLSPSDHAINMFDNEISTLITEYGVPTKKIISQDPNDKSVVLYGKIGIHRFLLGADLEVTKDIRTGWLDIINRNQVIDKKASLYKISHHGSINGYHNQIWTDLLETDTIANLTPWNRKDKLPEIEMLQTYCLHSKDVNITSSHVNDKPKKRDKTIEKIINSFNTTLREVKFDKGIIRCRIDINNDSDKWKVDLLGSAKHVNPLMPTLV